MTPADDILQVLDELAKKATKGRWQPYAPVPGNDFGICKGDLETGNLEWITGSLGERHGFNREQDADFVVALVNAYPKIAEEMRALRAQVAAFDGMRCMPIDKFEATMEELRAARAVCTWAHELVEYPTIHEVKLLKEACDHLRGLTEAWRRVVSRAAGGGE
jgi:hypothetical protein